VLLRVLDLQQESGCFDEFVVGEGSLSFPEILLEQ
jgi:hypothetical protein